MKEEINVIFLHENYNQYTYSIYYSLILAIVGASKSEVYEYQQIVIIHSCGTIFERHYRHTENARKLRTTLVAAI